MIMLRYLLLPLLVLATFSAAAVEGAFTNVSARNAQQIILSRTNSENFYLLDVRTDQEFAQAHIQGAKQLDFYSATFSVDLEKLDRDKTYLLYCRTGMRSARTFALMQQLGFHKVYNMRGGIVSWYQQRLPLVFKNINSETK
ncbi:MAG: hypothetical protein OFPI_30170 [Osedax symbiont Rs2]|nr:MAG: hypothetical protein OFPI_30170 [Osedax symbiont Rs2]